MDLAPEDDKTRIALLTMRYTDVMQALGEIKGSNVTLTAQLTQILQQMAVLIDSQSRTTAYQIECDKDRASLTRSTDKLTQKLDDMESRRVPDATAFERHEGRISALERARARMTGAIVALGCIGGAAEFLRTIVPLFARAAS